MKKALFSGYSLSILAALGFSLKSILAKLAYGYGLDVITLLLMRLYILCPLYLIALYLMEGRKGFILTRREFGAYLLLGLVGSGGSMYLSFLSIELLNASMATLIVYTYPAMTILMLGGAQGRFELKHIVAVFMTLLGLGLVLGVGSQSNLNLNTIGVLAALGGAFCFAFFNIMSGKLLKTRSPLKMAAFTVLIWTSFLSAAAGNRSYPSVWEPWVLGALLAIVAGFIPFLCYLYSLKKLGAAMASILSTIGPILNLLWAILLLGEEINAVQLPGGILVILGIMSLQYKPALLRMPYLKKLYRIISMAYFIKK